jgi:hypothetical protein
MLHFAQTKYLQIRKMNQSSQHYEYDDMNDIMMKQIMVLL